MFIKHKDIVKQHDYTKSMVNVLEMPKTANKIVVLFNGNIVDCISIRQARIFCEKMRLRIIGTSLQGQVYLIQAQKEDSSL